MLNVISQTRDERIIMFMKLTKRELIEMLLNAQQLEQSGGGNYTTPNGCICPPGAEQGCQSTFCPRRSLPGITTCQGVSEASACGN